MVTPWSTRAKKNLEFLGELGQLRGTGAEALGELREALRLRTPSPDHPRPNGRVAHARILGEHRLGNSALIYNPSKHGTHVLGIA